MIIQIDTELMNPHIFIDCEIKYRRELKIVHMFGRNHCYLSDLIQFMLEHYQQSESTTRRKCKEMATLHVLQITRSGKTYLSLMSLGLTYVTGKPVGAPRKLQNDIQLEKSHAILRTCKPTYILPRKSESRLKFISKNLGLSRDQAVLLFKQIEMRHIYLLKLEYRENLLVINLLQYDPYTDTYGGFYKLNAVINVIRELLNIKHTPQIKLNLQMITKHRTAEKKAIAIELQDMFSSTTYSLIDICKKRDSWATYILKHILWDQSSIRVKPY